jgi:hypothetical protein
MEVYLIASDTVGNAYESTHVELHASASGVSDGTIPSHWTLLGVPFNILLVLVGMIVCSVSVVMFGKTRRASDKDRSDRAEDPKFGPGHVTAPPTLLDSTPISAFERESVEIATRAPPARITATAPSQVVVVSAQVPDAQPPKLIDAIPTVIFESEEPIEDDELEMDFGKLIEDELIIPSLKNSVYRESIKDLNTEIEMRLEELRALCDERPKKTPGRF